MTQTHEQQVRRIESDNRGYATTYRSSSGPEPGRALAVVTCMDTRIDPLGAFGLHLGDAHILRNAGGVVTEDVIRSLCLSQRYLHTRDVVVVQHTDCGLRGLSDEELRRQLVEETGQEPPFLFYGFEDAQDSVRASLGRLQRSPFLSETGRVSGFVLDIETGRLMGVDPD